MILEIFLRVAIFLASVFVLAWLSSSFVKTVVEIARYLRWREFIIAFFVMGFAASLPNLFVDLSAALRGMPQISFGDIIGGNLIDLTLVMAIAIFFSKKGISTDSRMIQGSSIFTFLIAILPVFLIWTGRVTRLDGVILILAFFVYAYWLFSEDGRYKKFYRNTKKEALSPKKKFNTFLKNLLKLIALIAILLFAAQQIINSAQYFSTSLGVSLGLVGLIIVAMGNCFPETYFGIVAGRKEENWMIIGDVMGSIIVCATLVLGIIGVVSPFEIKDLSIFLIARIFTVIAAIFFLVVIRTDKRLTKKEALLLLFVYITFLLAEILVKYQNI